MVVLEVTDLNKSYNNMGIFSFKKSKNHVVKDFCLAIERGEIVGLVGNSGTGKSTIVKSILNLTLPDSGKIVLEGETVFDSENKINLYKNPKERLRIRKKIQIIMQDPYATLDPRMTIGKIVGEGIKLYFPSINGKELDKRLGKILELCGLDSDIMTKKPSELSGGQRQRVCIARALALEPRVLICDEITSSLDVSVQAQILNLLLDLREKLKLSILFISHDKEVVKCLCDKIVKI